MKEPVASKKKKTLKNNGDTRIDNYFWMRDKKDPEVLKYIKKENNYSKNWYKDHKKTKEKVLKELKSRVVGKRDSTPYFKNGFWYGTSFQGKKDYPTIWRSKTLKGKREILLDENKMAKGHAYFNISSFSISPDNRYIAYCLDVKANKVYNIYVKDLKTLKTTKEVVGVNSQVSWTSDSKKILFVEFDKAKRPFKIKSRELSTGRQKLIYKEENEIFYLGFGKTLDGEYFLFNSGSHDGDEIRCIKSDLTGKVDVLKGFKKGVEAQINHAGGLWYQCTFDKNKDGILYSSKTFYKDIKKWKKVYEAEKGSYINYFKLNKNKVLIKITKESTGEIITIDNKKKIGKIKKPQQHGDIGIFNVVEYDQDKVNIDFESMTYPDTVYSLDTKNNKLKFVKEYKPQGRYKKEDYESKKVMVKARDGQKIPMTILYKKNKLKKDGTNPCLIYGYGSYGHSVRPFFSQNLISLTNRGFVFAIAHIRGGRDKGDSWYQDGKYLNKKNTFNDFVDCSEYLIKNKYCDENNLFAQGGSAGGLLMGAVTNMRPDLYKGVVAQVPFVDSLNTMLDSTIPLTVGEYVEWGNPNIKKYYNYMKSYAPYENIDQKFYPNILVTAGFNDTQVHYWESLKYVAKLRDFNQSENKILLKMDVESGHGGKSGRYKYLEDVADVYTFLIELSKDK